MQDEVVFSETRGNDESTIFVKSRDGDGALINILKPRSTGKCSLYAVTSKAVKDVFLPQGFPNSVHSDYVPYQIWDTVQAFASTIMGTLTTHSIMKGVGVGESSATPLAAAVTWILKDGTGMVGRIVFAWWNGTDLDRQCKKWRLFADVLNDLAMGIELLIPYFPVHPMLVLCTSTTMKSVVGVAGAATRAALTQHQALQNNLADVSAKDGSQETCVNLIASFVGIFLLSYFHDGWCLVELYLLLVAVHLYANYRAVKTVCLNSFNEDRLALVARHYLLSREIPPPDVVNREESVLLFKRPTSSIYGFHVEMAASLQNVVQKSLMSPGDAERLLHLFRQEEYMIYVDVKRKTISVFLTKNADSPDAIKAYFHACLCALLICIVQKTPIDILMRASTNHLSYPLMRLFLLGKRYSQSTDTVNFSGIDITELTYSMVPEEYVTFLSEVKKAGWVVDENLLPLSDCRLSWKKSV